MKPCLRIKKRYVIIETLKNYEFEKIKDSIYKEALTFLGEKGTGELGLLLKKDIWFNKLGIIRVNHKKTNELKMIIGLLNEKAKTIKTTGSLKKAKKIIEMIK